MQDAACAHDFRSFAFLQDELNDPCLKANICYILHSGNISVN